MVAQVISTGEGLQLSVCCVLLLLVSAFNVFKKKRSMEEDFITFAALNRVV